MANTIHVDVVSAEQQIFSGEAEFVVLPGEAGEAGYLPPAYTSDHPHQAWRRTHQARRRWGREPYLRGGRHSRSAAIDGDRACRHRDSRHDLDEAKALEAQKRAEEALRNATDKQEIATLQAEFSMMAAQLAAIRKLRKK